MQTKSGEWWDYSWNLAPGCTKVGPECTNCWALSMAKRLQGMRRLGYEGLVNDKGQWTGRVNLIERKLEEPLDMKKPKAIAVNLMGDLFHPEVPFEFIEQIFLVMMQSDWHQFMILTKRPERLVEYLQADGWMTKHTNQIQNINLGTTAGTQRSANQHWASMAWLAQQGWNTWVSSEPRLEAINWHGWQFLKRMVTGGESGPYARPMSPAWARSDRDWCQEHGVAFWLKQFGEWGPEVPGVDLRNYPMTTMGSELVFRFGRKLAGRMLDGRTWEAVTRLNQPRNRRVHFLEGDKP